MQDFLEKEEGIHQIKQANEARAAFYFTLASLFYSEMTLDKIESFSQSNLAKQGEDSEEMHRAYTLMFRAVKKPSETVRQNLAVDYAHTFLAAGTYDGRMATPYESVFTSEEGLLMQDARDDVYRLFCQEHIGVRESSHEPEDHLSFEFEFLAILAQRCNAALREQNIAEAQRLSNLASDFLRQHILNWIDDLCDVIDTTAKSDFYRGLSLLTRAFTHDDKETLREMTGVFTEVSYIAESFED